MTRLTALTACEYLDRIVFHDLDTRLVTLTTGSTFVAAGVWIQSF